MAAVMIAILGVGVTVMGFGIAIMREIRGMQERTSREMGDLRERMARLEGLFEGFRAAPVGVAVDSCSVP